MISRLDLAMAARLLTGASDHALHWAQAAGLRRSAQLLTRLLAEDEPAPGQLAAWQLTTLDALLARLCDYDQPLPDPASSGALSAALGFIQQMPADTRQRLADAITLIEAGPALLGPKRHLRRFTRLPPSDQDAYLRAWEESPVWAQRAIFQGVKAACMMGYWSRDAAWGPIGYDLNTEPKP